MFTLIGTVRTAVRRLLAALDRGLCDGSVGKQTISSQG